MTFTPFNFDFHLSPDGDRNLYFCKIGDRNSMAVRLLFLKGDKVYKFFSSYDEPGAVKTEFKTIEAAMEYVEKIKADKYTKVNKELYLETKKLIRKYGVKNKPERHAILFVSEVSGEVDWKPSPRKKKGTAVASPPWAI